MSTTHSMPLPGWPRGAPVIAAYLPSGVIAMPRGRDGLPSGVVSARRATSAPSSPASASLDVDERKIVGAEVGHEERLAVRREGHAERPRGRGRIVGADDEARGLGILGARHRLVDVDERNVIALGVGARAFAVRGRDPRAVRTDRDAPRPRSHRDAAELGARRVGERLRDIDRPRRRWCRRWR